MPIWRLGRPRRPYRSWMSPRRHGQVAATLQQRPFRCRRAEVTARDIKKEVAEVHGNRTHAAISGTSTAHQKKSTARRKKFHGAVDLHSRSSSGPHNAGKPHHHKDKTKTWHLKRIDSVGTAAYPLTQRSRRRSTPRFWAGRQRLCPWAMRT